MNRRDLFRRTILAAALAPAAGAREFPNDYDASKKLASPDWKSAFLDDHQNQTLIELGDVIIPETDTPGAKAALVNRFIDHLLAAETREVQQRFLASLAFLDSEAFSHYHQAFVHLTPDQQTELVSLMAYPHLDTWDETNQHGNPAYEHFRNLKDWISRSFYNSEAGLRALGYDGPPHGNFEGCTS